MKSKLLITIAILVLPMILNAQELRTRKKNGLIGFFEGKSQVIDYKYDEVEHKFLGFYLVRMDDKYGVVSEKGVEIVPCKYDSIADGPRLGYTVSKDGFQGVIDSTGLIVLDLIYDEVQYFYKDSIALVKYKGQWCRLKDGKYTCELDQLVFQSPDRIPVFGDCVNGLAGSELKACSDKKMIDYVFQNLSYPREAVKNGIEGIVVISFVISRSGEIENAVIKRRIGGGCEEEALRMVRNMPRWTPGEQDGVKVSTIFNLPVKFDLGN